MCYQSETNAEWEEEDRIEQERLDQLEQEWAEEEEQERLENELWEEEEQARIRRKWEEEDELDESRRIAAQKVIDRLEEIQAETDRRKAEEQAKWIEEDRIRQEIKLMSASAVDEYENAAEAEFRAKPIQSTPMYVNPIQYDSDESGYEDSDSEDEYEAPVKQAVAPVKQADSEESGYEDSDSEDEAPVKQAVAPVVEQSVEQVSKTEQSVEQVVEPVVEQSVEQVSKTEQSVAPVKIIKQPVKPIVRKFMTTVEKSKGSIITKKFMVISLSEFMSEDRECLSIEQDGVSKYYLLVESDEVKKPTIKIVEKPVIKIVEKPVEIVKPIEKQIMINTSSAVQIFNEIPADEYDETSADHAKIFIGGNDHHYKYEVVERKREEEKPVIVNNMLAYKEVFTPHHRGYLFAQFSAIYNLYKTLPSNGSKWMTQKQLIASLLSGDSNINDRRIIIDGKRINVLCVAHDYFH